MSFIKLSELNQLIVDMEKAHRKVVDMKLNPFDRFEQFAKELYQMGYRKSD